MTQVATGPVAPGKEARDWNAMEAIVSRRQDGSVRKDCAMGDKSPKNTAKTKKQKSQKKAASVAKPAPKK